MLSAVLVAIAASLLVWQALLVATAIATLSRIRHHAAIVQRQHLLSALAGSYAPLASNGVADGGAHQ